MMALFENVEISDLNDLGRNTMAETIGIEVTEVGPDFLRGRMPVDRRTSQPFGLLHGGASVAFAETLGSIAGTLLVHHRGEVCVGLEINANHIRSVREGWVTGTARPLHIGASTQVWDIRIEDGRGKLVCASRLTLAVVKRRDGPGREASSADATASSIRTTTMS
jgi:1,4-dihydroxy-2-naphthoyl-CoA hydrolase